MRTSEISRKLMIFIRERKQEQIAKRNSKENMFDDTQIFILTFLFYSGWLKAIELLRNFLYKTM